jgi:uncharacterized protein (DUF111 family)
VVELFRGRPLLRGGGPGERLTPTAAALLAELVDEFAPQGAFTARATGLGAGTRDPEVGPANLVRVQLGEAGAGAVAEVWQLDVNLDDATGEEMGWCLEGLRAAGALDAWTTPVQMKKGRPGVQLTALARPGSRAALEAVVFERTPTLGLRWTRTERVECGRGEGEVHLEGFRVRLKLRHRPAGAGGSPFGPRDVSPEFDDLAPLAEARGWTLREAEQRVVERYLRERGGA